MKLDLLAISAHPDDVELGCAGTILASLASGKSVGILDLTRGELGTRGTPQIRQQEAEAAAKVLGVGQLGQTCQTLGKNGPTWSNKHS